MPLLTIVVSLVRPRATFGMCLSLTYECTEVSEHVYLELLGVQWIILRPHGGEWKWSIGLSRRDELYWRTLGRPMYLHFVRIGQRLDESVPDLLVLRDVVMKPCD